MAPLPPGAVIGMLGVGQLGRMTALAAARLGYRVHGYSARPSGEPLDQVTALRTVGDWDDHAALARFAAAVDVVGFEFENVPEPTVRFLAERVTVAPGAALLAACQDRLVEKRWLRRCGIETAPFVPVHSRAELGQALDELGGRGILKTRRFGYDGKGQVRIQPGDDLDAAWAAVGRVPCVLEGWLAFDCELSAVVARGMDGDCRVFPISRNDHEHGILRESHVPSGLAPAVEQRAAEVAVTLAEDVGLVGVMAIEFFALPGGRLVANEVAPRTHNSGHWTQDGCETSQFEQHVRALVGLPLGPVGLRGPTRMRNLLGDECDAVPQLAAEPGAHIHLYGKAAARPGRKMGHVNWVGPDAARSG